MMDKKEKDKKLDLYYFEKAPHPELNPKYNHLYEKLLKSQSPDSEYTKDTFTWD